jgi:hypothetical protein
MVGPDRAVPDSSFSTGGVAERGQEDGPRVYREF